jgi:hypothetical protein
MQSSRFNNRHGEKMKPPVVIIGIGELAGVFARAFLRNGHPVFPVTRDTDILAEANKLPDPLLVLVAVAEKDYSKVMETMPDQWRNSLVLLQNELLPRDWEAYHIENPTVISVWFEKKRGMDYNPLLPSPVHGPLANVIAESLAQIEIPCKILKSKDDLIFELVLKNVFVFTINIAGLVLEEGTTTSTLWGKNQKFTLAVANDIIDLQEFITGKTFDRNRLTEGLIAGIMGDPNHKCKGRSAPGRLRRAIEVADEAGLKIESIRDVDLRFPSARK